MCMVPKTIAVLITWGCKALNNLKFMKSLHYNSSVIGKGKMSRLIKIVILLLPITLGKVYIPDDKVIKSQAEPSIG